MQAMTMALHGNRATHALDWPAICACYQLLVLKHSGRLADDSQCHIAVGPEVWIIVICLRSHAESTLCSTLAEVTFDD